MLNVEISMKRLAFGKIHERWFYETPDGSGPQLVTYYHCKSTAPINGYARKPKFTFLVNLNDTEDAIADRFVKNTRYEVRRAAKDGVTTASGATQDEFREFFDGFAEEKNREPLDARELDAYWPHLLLTRAMFQNETLVMHSYLLDRQSGRACLLHSASQFRGEVDSARRSLIGRANRFLHFQDMLTLKKDGFVTYDFGGCSPQTEDPELSRINDFKAGFGGTLTEESTYVSNSLTLLQKVKTAFARD